MNSYIGNTNIVQNLLVSSGIPIFFVGLSSLGRFYFKVVSNFNGTLQCNLKTTRRKHSFLLREQKAFWISLVILNPNKNLFINENTSWAQFLRRIFYRLTHSEMIGGYTVKQAFSSLYHEGEILLEGHFRQICIMALCISVSICYVQYSHKLGFICMSFTY